LSCEREQVLLMPSSLRDWLPEDHLAWFMLATVEKLDLGAFYASYRADGHGRAAHDPAMMVALLYAYARGQRSSRGIERSCGEDIAFGVVAANQVPDHATIARFRQRHEDAIAELFGSVLGLCARAGMVEVGVIAIDGTKMRANASQHANRDYERIARQILGEADAVDREEDAQYGQVAAMNYRQSSRRARAASAGCVAPSAISTSGAPLRPGRSRARAKRVCRRRSAVWMRNWRSNAQQTGV
jgi:transposase